MSGKYATWAGAGGIAAGLVATGIAVDRRLGTGGRIGGAAAALAGAYLAGTFFPGVRLFGGSAGLEGADVFALTFDDGPDPRHTPAISRILADRGHHGTFFVLGRAVRAHPDVAAAVLADGHALASHGDDHRLLAFAGPRELHRQLSATETAVHDATGALPLPLFRPPHGVRSPWLTSVAATRGYQVCSWHGSVFDTAERGTETIVARVAPLLRPGAIVLLHDGDGSGRGASRSQTVQALPSILEAAERRGLRSVAL